MKKQPRDKRPKTQKRTFGTDGLMMDLYEALVTDLAPFGVPLEIRDAITKRDVAAIRQFTWPSGNSAISYKRIYQLESFFKRYIFKKDLFTESELSEKAKGDFLDSQKKFGLPKELPLAAEEVLSTARSIVHSVLGEFSFEIFTHFCRFGRGAARNLPLRDAYLDNRLNKFSGTIPQHELFRRVIEDDKLLSEITAEADVVEVVEDVMYSLVPKSYKAHRGIAPDTIIGGFLSQGLGRYIRAQLECNTHIKLDRAQTTHRRLAKKASVDGRMATLDLQKASDSFTWDHVSALVPQSWHEVCGVVKTPLINIDGVQTPLVSYMLMGSGHTFPLQTLLFYSIVEACRVLSGTKGRVHVFGDDIICPTRISSVAIKMLQSLGFSINVEKSFYGSEPRCFRESCGGDFYDGVNVRPYMYKGLGTDKLSLNQYLSKHLQLANGLFRTWPEVFISNALQVLRNSWRALTDRPMPKGIPGVTGDGQAINTECFLLDLEDYALDVVNGTCAVTLIVEERKKRIAASEKPYYWDALRSSTVLEEDEYYRPKFQLFPTANGNADGLVDAKRTSRLSEPQKGGRCRYKWKTKYFPLWYGV
jgi:hypothetical protein